MRLEKNYDVVLVKDMASNLRNSISPLILFRYFLSIQLKKLVHLEVSAML